MAGRDADTVAAMLGNLLGALHGTDAFPARWRGDNLEAHDGLIALADAVRPALVLNRSRTRPPQSLGRPLSAG